MKPTHFVWDELHFIRDESYPIVMKATLYVMKAISFQWKEIVRIMNAQKAVTTFAQNKVEDIILIRRCTYPDEKVRLIYDKLGYKYAPFKKKKSVVHKSVFEKFYPIEYWDINSS
ncbi:MAG: hypothetical protein LBE13_08525 [Bacteroidales bacterium]|jgi:hypothetical protein|nr:hypothetical protein [Bacteroidales bacterium]